MSSFGNHQISTESENSNRHSEIPNTFRRKYVNDWRLLCPRRYVLALMLFILFIIQAWRSLNIVYTLAHVIILGEEEAKIKYSSIGHWKLKELDDYKMGALVASIFAQMPGALLIFKYSSHKFLLISVAASSVFHLLMPVALNHHSMSVLFLLVTQCFAAAPMYVAVMAIWRDWSTPAERTKLVAFSMYGLFIGAAATNIYPFLFPYLTTNASFYLSGIAGLIWSLFWFNIMSDTPQNDVFISEEELIYIESNLPSDHLQKIKLKDVPWRLILSSKPVLVLCLIFFKMACSVTIITISGTIYGIHLSEKYNPLFIFIPFLTSFITLLPLSAVLADFLINKFRERTLLIRKVFICGGFFLQFVLTFGTLAYSELTKAILYMIAYSVFAVSVSGFITLPLDLSPRYVPIISGIVFTLHSAGIACTTYFMEATLFIFNPSSLLWLYLFDGGLSIMSIVFFAMWGEVEEQPWSLTFPSNRNTNDYRSYPKPEDEDNLNLVT